ncbi:hypothetical protein Thiowin_03317 [Thiorhodovibrio winogradskyi]|uniref:Uncharacterized protein n=2 Tax=Thiorhodovibrio winogradskyi TaxID=77007 RepID=A0ABZ0SD64_9GAMM
MRYFTPSATLLSALMLTSLPAMAFSGSAEAAQEPGKESPESSESAADNASNNDSNPAGSPSEVREETDELLKDLQAYGADQRDQAMAASQAALEKADARINAMQDWIDENWSDMSETARQEARASMDALRERRTQVAEAYGGMETSTESAWEAMKTGFGEAYHALGEAWHQSMEAFSSDEQAEQ